MNNRKVLGWLAAGATAAFLLFVVMPVAVLLFTINALFGAGATTCQGAGGPTTAGGGAPAPNGNQASYAQMITSIVAARGLPQQAAVVAIATAAQESGLGQVGMNVALDHDSLGLFQQRPSAGWGSPAQVKDPTFATNAFLDHLVKIGNWFSLPVTQAAQAVQGSAFPQAYAKWEAEARGLAAKFWPAGTPPGGNPTAAAQQASAATPSAAGAQDCPGQGGDGLAPGGGTTTAPPGLPAPADPAAKAAVSFALAQLGKPYQWGATGPGAYDCSGLMVASWRAAGITLPRTAATQSGFGTPISDPGQLQPGDLIFIPGADGTPAAPGHVGMYVGNGQLINAPDEGNPSSSRPSRNGKGRSPGCAAPTARESPDAPAPAVQA